MSIQKTLLTVDYLILYNKAHSGYKSSAVRHHVVEQVAPHVRREDGASFFTVKQLKKNELLGLLEP